MLKRILKNCRNFIILGLLLLLCSTNIGISNISLANENPAFPLMWNLKGPTEYFVGREEFLKSMHEFLFKQNNQQALVVSGSAGSGKTQVILRYGELHKPNYNIVWGFDLNKDLDEQYRNFALNWNNVIDKLYPDNSEQNFLHINLELVNTQNLQEQIWDKLRVTKLNWLIIFDNAKTSAGIFKNIPEKHDSDSYGHIIIATQDSTPHPNVMLLDKLTKEESVELLLKITGANDSHNAGRLAETLHGYPLAVSKAGKFIASYSSTINMEQYNQLFLNKRHELWEAEEQLRIKRVEFDSYQETIFTSLSPIISAMRKESELAYELLAMVAYLDNDGIPKSLLQEYVKLKTNQPINEMEFNRALAVLTQYSLLNLYDQQKAVEQKPKQANQKITTKEPTDKELFFTTHELIQLVMQELLKEEEKKHYLSQAITATNQLLPNNLHFLIGYINQAYYFISHITQLSTNADALKLVSNELIGLELKALEYNLPGIRNDQEAEKLIARIEKLQQQVKNPDALSKIRLIMMKSMFVAWNKGDYPASLKQALIANDLNNDLKIKPNEESLMIYSRLARLYSEMGQIQEAQKYADLASGLIELNPELVGYQKDLFKTLVKIYLAQGNYQQALEYSNRSIATNSDKPNQPILPKEVSLYLVNVDLLIQVGKYKEALQTLDRLDQIDETLLASGDNPYKANIMTYRSYVQAILGHDLNQALKLALAAQEKLKQALGEKTYFRSRHAFKNHLYLGEIYEKQKDYRQADVQYVTGLKILSNMYKRSGHTVSDDLSDLYHKLAIINIKLQQPVAATEYLKLHRKVFGKQHPRSIKLEDDFIDSNIDVGF
ncbi:MAG: hypothetical protein WBJ81_05340 [Rickettsiales bacterium]